MKKVFKKIHYIFLLQFLFIAKLYAAPGGSPITIDNPLNVKTLQCFIAEGLKLVVNLGAIICVFFIIYSGFLFVTAQGNDTKISKARETFFWTVVGTAVLLGAWVIAQIISGTLTGILNQNIAFGTGC